MRQAMMFSKRGTSAAEVQAAIDASAGGGQMPYIEPVPIFSAAGATLSANTAFLQRFRVGRSLQISNITIHVGNTPSGNVDVGIYRSDDGGTTLTRIGSSGTTACGSANTPQTINLSSAVTLSPGVDYWLAFAVDNATALILRAQGAASGSATNAAIANRSLSKGSSFPLPTSLSSLSGNANLVWMLAA